MTELIVLLFSNISLIFIAIAGALLFLYEPAIAKNIKKHILAISSILLFYIALFDLVPTTLFSRRFSVPVFSSLFILSLFFFFLFDFIKQKISSIRNFKTPVKHDFATIVYLTAVIFIISGLCIGVNFALGLGSGILTATALSVVMFSKTLHIANILSDLKIAKHRIIKSLALATVIVIPFSLLAYLISSAVPLLGSIFAIFITAGLLFLAIYVLRELISLTGLRISITKKPKKKGQHHDPENY